MGLLQYEKRVESAEYSHSVIRFPLIHPHTLDRTPKSFYPSPNSTSGELPSSISTLSQAKNPPKDPL